jgi:peptide/nickel transport system permease protein
LDVLKHAILPVLAYFLTTVSGWILSMKANSLSIMGEDYITYAQVRGLPNRRIVLTYLSKNAILPMITNLAVSFGLLFGGSPLIENMFFYPGVGYFLNNAIAKRDYTLMQGMFFVIIIMVVASNLLVEIMYRYLDPRLREQ